MSDRSIIRLAMAVVWGGPWVMAVDEYARETAFLKPLGEDGFALRAGTKIGQWVDNDNVRFALGQTVQLCTKVARSAPPATLGVANNAGDNYVGAWLSSTAMDGGASTRRSSGRHKNAMMPRH
jgi:hypothetical protein